MFELKLKNFILTHDNWEELLAAEPYCLKISRDNGYISFSYNQLASDFNEELVREARGIIFKEENWKCVAYAFSKFGNWGESYVKDFDFSSMVVSEKIDGSLIKVWYDEGWHVSTNGTIDANKALLNNAKFKSFMDLFSVAAKKVGFSFSRLRKNRTYFFELVSPYSQVVIPYSEIDLYTLGARDMETGKEISMERAAAETGVRSPKIYLNKSLDQVQKMAEELPWSEEGYVCIDKYFNRCKIKSPAYVAAHYARNNNVITEKRLLNIVLKGEEEEFLLYCPDYSKEFYRIKHLHESMKNYAIAAKEHCEKFTVTGRERFVAINEYCKNKTVSHFVLAHKDKTWDEFIECMSLRKYLDYLKEFEKEELI